MLTANQLISAIRSGDESCLDNLYGQYREGFLGWARKHYPIDDHTLIDLYQDSVIIFYQNVVEERISELTSSPKTYLFGIAKHLIIRELNRRKKAPLVMDEVAEVSVAPKYLQQTESDHQRVVLQQALDKLGYACRQLIEYFYYYNFSTEAIAKRMRYKNEDTVKAKKYRCLKQLEEIVRVKKEAL